MQKIRIAQIGTSQNSHGMYIWQSLTKQTDIFDVVGYALPENEREKFPKECKVFDGYKEMTVEEILSDPTIEAVAVETEEIYLTKYSLMVAKAGKHLHMEKPGGVCLADFEEMIATLKEKKLAFTVGYMYRFNPAVREALRAARAGELGRIFSVEAYMCCKHAKGVREWLECFPGGMLFFLGCHLVDLIYQIQGEPKEVIPLSCSSGIDGLSTCDYGMAVFKYDNGVSFAKTCDNEMGGFLRRQLVICGEKGSIEVKPLESVVDEIHHQSTLYKADSEDWNKPWECKQTELYDRYDNMMRNFAEIVRGKENPYPYDYELNLYKLVLRACGQEVK